MYMSAPIVAWAVVQAVQSEDVFEAGRHLHIQFELKLIVRQGQVLVDFVAMATWPTRHIELTRS